MTVSAQSPVVTRVYTGPGDYDFDFLVYDVANLEMTIVDTSGVPQTLTVANYSAVTLSPNPGGTVTITDALGVLPLGTLYIRRTLAYQQTIDWINNEAFNMELLERSQDQMVMMLQQIDSIVKDAMLLSTWRGTWVTPVTYNAKDLVVAPNGNWYACLETHTSDDFTADLAAGYWVLALDLAAVTALRDECLGYAEDTAADLVLTNADVVLTHADVVLTNADVVLTHADVVQTGLDRAATAADLVLTNEDVVTTQGLVDSIDTPTILRKDADTGAAILPPGTTAQRPSVPSEGMLRYNTDLKSFEGYADGVWGTVGGGASGAVQNPVFYENDTNVTGDYTITTGKNAVSAGPIEIDDDVTVTVPDGSVWTVV
jgi:hypothetical protein